MKGTLKTEVEVQPFLEPKAELEVEERQKHELKANDIRPDLVGEETRQEVATDAERPILNSLRLPHELRGYELFQKLVDPS